MDGREGMALSGFAPFYLHGGASGSGSGTDTDLHVPPGFRNLSNNPSSSFQINVRGSSVESTIPVENPSPNFPHGLNIGVASGVPLSEPAKKKRGRPRKYRPETEGANMSLGLSPMSLAPSSGSVTQILKVRGRPPGTGKKQRLASLGEWMSDSAGLAFTPHVINIAVGEDIAAKILSFSQQRPRAVCILSANGAVSAVTLYQPASFSGTVTYEGRFEILCLSGSYLLSESGGTHNRTGGLSVSLCSPNGHVFGGGVKGMFIAASPVQVVVCSFVYGGSKTKDKIKVGPKDKGEENSALEPREKSATPANAAPGQKSTPNSALDVWPPGSRPDLRNPHTEIDLTRG
ncbi:AT-hook motif nuclear-localized protein 5-like [Cornus florida]|uniref:AT-hook motif nuclear-localized protein 5-like n=1 Tax=Cornus florida TaxID=4283 RepID=UPI0028978D1B|nr:AT-hook motif nuclear-localized protein 5-like [Cornus florida]